jgi:uncharacterized membrane protein
MEIGASTKPCHSPQPHLSGFGVSALVEVAINAPAGHKPPQIVARHEYQAARRALPATQVRSRSTTRRADRRHRQAARSLLAPVVKGSGMEVCNAFQRCRLNGQARKKARVLDLRLINAAFAATPK